ncbi:hypothetical protein LSAT2_009845, partial [Lamellibrachia satsuma]
QRDEKPVVAPDGASAAQREEKPAVAPDGAAAAQHDEKPVVAPDGAAAAQREEKPVVAPDGAAAAQREEKPEKPFVAPGGAAAAQSEEKPVVAPDGAAAAQREEKPVVAPAGAVAAQRQEKPVVVLAGDAATAAAARPKEKPTAASAHVTDDGIVANPGYLAIIFMWCPAQQIYNNYQHFGVILGLNMNIIQAIKVNYRDVTDRAFEVVKVWSYNCEKPGLVTAYEKLCDALCKIGRSDLVRFVKHEAWKNSSPTPSTTADPTETGICVIRADEQGKMYADKQSVQLINKPSEIVDDGLEGESEKDTKRRILNVMYLIRRFQQVELWSHVSALLVHRGKLDISNVTKKVNLVDVEYLLTSGVASCVTKLNLSCNDVFGDEEGVGHLCKGLEGMIRLERLGLKSTELTDAGFTRVCHTLRSSCRLLTHLVCDNNPLTGGVIDTVTETMRDLSGLTIYLTHCRLSPSVNQRMWRKFRGRIHLGNSDDDDTD